MLLLTQFIKKIVTKIQWLIYVPQFQDSLQIGILYDRMFKLWWYQ
jgi:hypothetical protein